MRKAAPCLALMTPIGFAVCVVETRPRLFSELVGQGSRPSRRLFSAMFPSRDDVSR